MKSTTARLLDAEELLSARALLVREKGTRGQGSRLHGGNYEAEDRRVLQGTRVKTTIENRAVLLKTAMVGRFTASRTGPYRFLSTESERRLVVGKNIAFLTYHS
ncbi:hypothetical protein MRB53_039003 [Persea americana]|nr:hypothetical protein MRB53_039003 [Persea americana]